MCVWLPFPHNTCSTSLPSGNQVDGLPLVVNSVLLESNTGENVIGPSFGSYLCTGRDPLIGLNFLSLCQIQIKLGERSPKQFGLSDVVDPVSVSSLEKKLSST